MLRSLALLALTLPHALAGVLFYATPLVIRFAGMRVMTAPGPLWLPTVATVLAVIHALGLMLVVLLPHRVRLIAAVIGLGLTAMWLCWTGVVLLDMTTSHHSIMHGPGLPESAPMWLYGALLGTCGVPASLGLATSTTASRRIWPVLLTAPVVVGCAAIGMLCQMMVMKTLWGVYWFADPEVITQTAYLATAPLSTLALVLAVWTRPVPESE